METLQKLMVEAELDDIKSIILAAHKHYYKEVGKMKKNINEGVLDFDSNDLGFMFEEARKRFLAAKNAVKIANKLGDPEQKSRVFRNLNQLRALVSRLTKAITTDLESMEQSLKGKQMFDQRPIDRTNQQFGRSQQQPIDPNRQQPKRFNQPQQ
jgi:hypothetical protein